MGMPIYDDECLIIKDNLQNMNEEQLLIDEQKSKSMQLEQMSFIDPTKEETPSIDFEDDRQFKKKLLFQPKWASNDDGDGLREYPRLSVKDYYAAKNEILNNVKYCQNMHLHRLQIEQQLKEKEDAIMNDSNMNRRQKLEMIEQMKQATNNELNKAQKLPFDHFLSDMHQYVEQDNVSSSPSPPLPTNNYSKFKSMKIIKSNQDEDIVNTMGLKPQMSNTSNSCQSFSWSTLGPSKSVVEYNENEEYEDQTVSNNHIDWSETKPTQQMLDQLNLQQDNNRLLAEIQRLRSIVFSNKQSMNMMENEIDSLNEQINDKQIQTKTLRSTNISLTKRNNELMEENKGLQADNDRLNKIVHDYPLMDHDEEVPLLSLHKSSDISDDSEHADFIDPNLLNAATRNRNRHKFNQLTKMRNSCKQDAKQKNKRFSRRKYHSFAMVEAKQQKKKKEYDPLISVKDKLHSMTLLNLMPSQTQITPQTSQRSTPLILSDQEAPSSPPLICVNKQQKVKIPNMRNMMDMRGKSYDHINSFHRHDISSLSPKSNTKKKQQQQALTNKSFSKLMSMNKASTKRRSFINHRHKMPYVEDDDASDISLKNLKRVSIKYTKSAHTLYSKQSSPKLTAKKQRRTDDIDIPLFFKKSQKGRNYSKSFSVHKSRKHRSGSIHTKSSYPSNAHILKDRTKTNSLPQKTLLNPTVQNDEKYKKNVSQKRRSVNLNASRMHKTLKTRTNKNNKREFMSKSPKFGPKSNYY